MKNIAVAVTRTEDLSVNELLNIFKERVRVFVVEQNCPYQEVDHHDDEALHVIFYDNKNIVAYSRIIDHGEYYSFGRVLVVKEYRKHGLGKKIVDRTIKEIQSFEEKNVIKIQAQAYLEDFYQSFGFVSTSEVYLEDDIPHLDMERKINKIYNNDREG